MKRIRSPIVSVLGHVDHGKTTLLDAIRNSRVAEKEAGKITQMIGASLITSETINKMAGKLKEVMKIELVIPGLLFIDTPGHEVFTNLRVRGGSIADIAILVIDIKQGIQPQTVESINILKDAKTPFVIALNKIDLIDGWKKTGSTSFLEALSKQGEHTRELLENRIYEIMGQLSYHGFDSERFDRVGDFTKQIALMPVSAKTREGLAELLLMVAGLSQKYLKERLYIDPSSKARGSILEVKEEKGLGVTVDGILYDGVLREGDSINLLTRNGVINRKIRALLMPNVSSNNPREKYRRVKEVVAAAGIKIAAPELEEVLPGSPFSTGDVEELKKELQQLIFENDDEGVVAKADSLGSAEALFSLLKKEGIKVSKLDIGDVSKEDVKRASAIAKTNPLFGVVVGFNVRVPRDVETFAKEEGVELIVSDVIYKIPERYQEFVEALKAEESKQIEEIAGYPAKIRALPGFFFRQSKPAVFGIRVLEGKLKAGAKLIDESGKLIGEVKGIQEKGEAKKEAYKGAEVAISVEGAVLGKDIKEGDVLYTMLKDVEALEKNVSLNEDEKELVREISKIQMKSRLSRLG